METGFARAPESTDFGFKIPENPCKSRKKSVQICSGRRSRKFAYRRYHGAKRSYLVSPFGECCTSTISSVNNTSELWTLDFFCLWLLFLFTFIFSYFICLISPLGYTLLRHTLFESINLYKGYLTSFK